MLTGTCISASERSGIRMINMRKTTILVKNALIFEDHIIAKKGLILPP